MNLETHMTQTPTTREGTIANDLGNVAQEHTLFDPDDRMIILYKGGEDAVVVMFGYRELEHEKDGLLDLLIGMAAVLEAHGHNPELLVDAFKDKLPPV